MRIGAAMAIVLLLSSCNIFRRPDNQFYSLETIPAAGPIAAASGPPIGVDGVELPPTMARRGIVVRDENGKLEVRGTHQWAAPLEDMVVHTIAFNLANRLPEGAVILPGQPRPAAAAKRALFVVFEELAPNPEGVFVLDARWTLASPGTVGAPNHERITLELESMESPAVVTTMSRALAMLTERIIARM